MIGINSMKAMTSMTSVKAKACAKQVHRRAFTLIEIMVTVVIIVTVAALTLPYFGRTHADRANAAADLFESDLRYAQIASMANTQDPVIVRFKADGTGYWLARLSAPDVAIVRPDTTDTWNITMGQGRARMSANVALSTSNISGQTLRFTPLGSVQSPSGTPTIIFTASGPGGPSRSCTITVDTVTGRTTAAYQ